MNKLDFDAVNQALDAETVVPRWLPDGHKRGDEWVARNPTRADRNPGSFTINLRGGAWKDFATGDGGSDLVSLYAYLHHANDQGAAARELADNHGVRIGDPETRERAAETTKITKLDDAKPVPIMPVPAHATAPTFYHPQHGRPDPSKIWPYTDKHGNIALYVCRFDPAGERKYIGPYSWCRNVDGTEGWRWRGISGNARRPLYGLDILAADPEADAIVVEGEPSCEAARRLFGTSAIVTTWMGGVETADHVGVLPLAGRRVVLWPDFDSQRQPLTKAERDAGVDPASKPLLPFHEQPGIRAMMALATALKGVAREVILVGYTMAERKHGWDLADAEAEGWDAPSVMNYMAQNAGDPWHIASAKPTRTEPAAPAPAETLAQPAAGGDHPDIPTPANDNVPRVPLDAAINPFGWPHLGDKGSPMNTVENLEYLLGEYGITIRYNLISKNVEIRIPELEFSQDNHLAACMATIGSLCSRNRLPRADIAEYMILIADSNPYNPAAEWIDSKAWDGTCRIAEMVDTLDPLDRDLAVILMRRWMIGAAGCVYEPAGMSMQGVLVLQGEQYSGKTAWFWSLTGRNRQLAREGVSLNPSDRDSVKGAISYWIVELGELDATFRKSDIAALKSFLTRDTDELFLRYSRSASTFARRTAFVGTVNPRHFLHDETGNRRYWTIRHGPKMRGLHDVDVQQFWAQAKSLWQSGEQHRLTRDEMTLLNAANEEHQETSSIGELIQSRFNWESPSRPELMTATEVLVVIGYDRPNNKQSKDAGQVLRTITGGDPKKSNGRLVFAMPPQLAGPRSGQAAMPFGHHDETRPF